MEKLTREEIGSLFIEVANVVRSVDIAHGIQTAYRLAMDVEIYSGDKRVATALRTQARTLQYAVLGLTDAAAIESKKVGTLLA
jgi:hypothetical protein